MDIQRELEKEWGSKIFEEPSGEYEEGFNFKSILGAIFLGFVMLPAAIYLHLVAGEQGMGSAAQWVTIILFTELARRSFTKLRRQEIFILYVIAGGLVVTGGPFFHLLWNQFYVQSADAMQSGIAEELSRPENIWIAPPAGSPAFLTRSFFHRAWVPAIFVVIASQILFRISHFTLGYSLFRLTSDVERLPFPLAPVAAQAATSLAESYEEKETWRWRVFSIGASIGLIFGIIYLVIPALTGGVMNRPIELLPIPWWDLTLKFERYLPAALIGIGTNLTLVLMGAVLPFSMVSGMFVTSILTHIVANPILYKLGVLKNWRAGAGTIPTAVANHLDLWLSIEIGILLLIAFMGILLAVQNLLLKPRERVSFRPPKGRGDFSVFLCLFFWFVSTSGIVYLCHRLVPGFPVSILAFFGFIWTPLNSYISARMIGLTGQRVQFPFFREASFVLATRKLGFQGASIWFAPVPLGDYGGAAQFFRQLTLTKTKFTSYLKAELIIFPLLLTCSIIFCAFLWKISAIPSPAYPFAAKLWPMGAFYRTLWATATKTGKSFVLEAIKLDKVALGGGIGLLFFAITRLFNLPTLFFYGLCQGVRTWPHLSIPMFIGALIGKYHFQKRFGKEKWRSYVIVASAGFLCGMGLAGMISIGIVLISRAVIQLPY